MSTPRWKAREVKKLHRNRQYKTQYWFHDYYETEDGRRFTWARTGEWNKDTKFFMLKRTNEYRYNEWRYFVYPIPFNQAVGSRWGGTPDIMWYGDKRCVLVEIKLKEK